MKTKIVLSSILTILSAAMLLTSCTKDESGQPQNGNSNAIQNTSAQTSSASQTPSEPTPTPIPDFEAPKLYGVVKKQFYVGEGISYLSGVYAIDDTDTDVEIAVNRDKVDTKIPGTYEIVYTAKDDAGNTTSETTTITLVEATVTQEEVESLAQAVLDKIITENMSQVEKMWEIYKYVNSSMTYDGYSNKDDWRAEAKRGFENGYGDCFTYFSMSDLLLEKIGVEKLKVNRVGGISNHYWHMVKVDGKWYHFDPCYRRPTWSAFLRTDAEVAAFADRISIEGYEYYTYDKTKYPAVSTEEFEWNRDSYTDKR